MGVSYRVMEFLTYCGADTVSHNLEDSLRHNVSFVNTLTLGRACFYALASREKTKTRRSLKDIDRFLSKHIPPSIYDKDAFFRKLEKARAANFPDERYSEPFFELLGANTVDSIDISDYEEATVISDLSFPVSDSLKNKYSCVFDGGVLNSVFDYKTALNNAMQMVKIGGHLILTTPGNDYFGHGFYQLSPELFYSVLREENGYSDTYVYTYNATNGNWYYCENPRVRKCKCEISPRWGKVQLCVVSKKIGDVPNNYTAYQSNFESLWIQGSKSEKRKKIKLLTTAYAATPEAIRDAVRYSYEFKKCFRKVRLWV